MRKSAPTGVIYSASPRVGTAFGGGDYIVKGPQPEIVVPEALSTHLLRAVALPGVRVPPMAAVQLDGSSEIHFGSLYLSSPNPIDPHLPRYKQDAAAIVAADIWLGNKDRNIGNFLLDFTDDLGLGLLAIDFGAAGALQRGATVLGTLVQPKQLWPQGIAATILGKLPWPENTIMAIQGVEESTIRSVANEVAMAFPCFTWVDDAVYALKQRAKQIRQLARQAWNDCNR